MLYSLGNSEILNLSKVAFLCSRQISAGAVLKCYDWGISKRESGECVLSGFHSAMEKDVMHYLLKGKQPVIMALARGLKAKVEPELTKHIDSGRLLIISPFEKEVIRVTEQTSFLRNKMMMEIADEVVIGYKHPEGQLHKLVNEFEGVKRITYLQQMDNGL